MHNHDCKVFWIPGVKWPIKCEHFFNITKIRVKNLENLYYSESQVIFKQASYFETNAYTGINVGFCKSTTPFPLHKLMQYIYRYRFSNCETILEVTCDKNETKLFIRRCNCFSLYRYVLYLLIPFFDVFHRLWWCTFSHFQPRWR